MKQCGFVLNTMRPKLEKAIHQNLSERKAIAEKAQAGGEYDYGGDFTNIHIGKFGNNEGSMNALLAEIGTLPSPVTPSNFREIL